MKGHGVSLESINAVATGDTTLQEHDHWFYSSTEGIRSLDELINVIHL